MDEKKIVKNQGFTLIEVVITIVILSIIAALGGKILQAGFNAYLTNQYTTTANAQARLALERMTRDIHAINSPSSITTATSSQLVFRDIYGNSVTYALSGTQLLRNSQVLADYVGSFSLAYLNSSGATTASTSAIRYVTVSLNITDSDYFNYNLRTTISTMNFL